MNMCISKCQPLTSSKIECNRKRRRLRSLKRNRTTRVRLWKNDLGAENSIRWLRIKWTWQQQTCKTKAYWVALIFQDIFCLHRTHQGREDSSLIRLLFYHQATKIITTLTVEETSTTTQATHLALMDFSWETLTIILIWMIKILRMEMEATKRRLIASKS